MSNDLFSIADELDEIRIAIELASELPMTADPRRVVDRHAPRLLAAAEAVLDLHPPSRTVDGTDVCPRCAWVAGKTVLADDCELRVALTAALTGGTALSSLTGEDGES